MNKVKRDISQAKIMKLGGLIETKKVRDRVFGKITTVGAKSPRAKEARDEGKYVILDEEDIIPISEDQFMFHDEDVFGYYEP